MFKNYFTVAFRNLIRQKAFTFINLAGLTIGILCFLIIALWVNDELSYDKYHIDYERIFRVGTDARIGEEGGFGTSTTPPLAPALMEEVPEVESAARIVIATNKLISNKENGTKFLENRLYYADSTIFKIFTIPVIKGNPNKLLTRKKTIVLTESMAEKYYGNENPIGKTITIDNRYEYEIVGVVEDCPSNTHWHFDFLVSMISIQRAYSQEWLSNNLTTYIKIKENTTVDIVVTKMNELFRKYAAPIFLQALGIPLEEWEGQGNHYRLRLNPLKDLYLTTSVEEGSLEPAGSMRSIMLFAFIGCLILFIACINFMNLTTARSAIRAKEIGMRKVLGSSRKQLVRQFLLESIIISIISTAFAFLILIVILPYFNNFVDKDITLNFAGMLTAPILFGLAIVVGLISGGYSSVSLSSFKPLSVLKGSLFTGKQRSWFRNSLVLFQFSISIIVVVCTIIAYFQMQYIKNKDLGFDREQILIIDRAHTLGDQLESFRDVIKSNPDVINASITYSVPGTSSDGSMFQIDDAPPEDIFFFRRLCGDFDYLETLGVEIVSGRNFSPDLESDKSKVLVNQQAAKYWNIQDPVGKNIIDPTTKEPVTIIGVFKDFHVNSLYEKIEPAMLHHPDIYNNYYVMVKLHSQNVNKALKSIRKEWETFSDNQPLDYFFMDTFFNNLHSKQIQTGYFFTIFSIIAVFIACLGLFGLAAFTAERKTREIGIRKVLGASVKSIVFILLKQFTRWVLLANIIAWPVAWWIMKGWLQNFAYRIDINLGYFVLAGFLTLVISALTVAYLTIRAATANPVKALKCE